MQERQFGQPNFHDLYGFHRDLFGKTNEATIPSMDMANTRVRTDCSGSDEESGGVFRLHSVRQRVSRFLLRIS